MSNSSVCVDASYVVRLLLGGEHGSAVTLWREWHMAGRVPVAPTLLYYEVGNALYRYAVHGELSQEMAGEVMNAALGLKIVLYGDADLHQRALVLTRRFALPAAYDGHYLALAERLGVELWTADGRLFRTVQSALSWVHLLGPATE